jgi:hypothetical protein
VIRAHVEAFQAWMIATRSASTALNAGLNTSDNITIDQAGNLPIREDPGQNVQEARIVTYRPWTSRLEPAQEPPRNTSKTASYCVYGTPGPH